MALLPLNQIKLYVIISYKNIEIFHQTKNFREEYNIFVEKSWLKQKIIFGCFQL